MFFWRKTRTSAKTKRESFIVVLHHENYGCCVDLVVCPNSLTFYLQNTISNAKVPFEFLPGKIVQYSPAIGNSSFH